MRTAVAVLGVVGALALAGCSGGSGGEDPSSAPAPSRSSSASASPSSSGSASAGGSSTSAVPSVSPGTSAAAVGTVTPPPAPSVPSGYRGAYTLTAGGTSALTGYLTSVACGQDGSMTADQLTLAPGATSVTLTTQPTPLGPITLTGSADLDAAGGTFRGADADQAITVVWTC